MKPPAKPRTPRLAPGATPVHSAQSELEPAEVADLEPRRTSADDAGHDLIVAADTQELTWLEERAEVREPLSIRPPTALDARRLEKKRSARRVLLVRIAVISGIVAVLAGLGWVVFASSLLALKADRIEVEGGGVYVDSAAITAMVAQHEGTALALLPTGEISDSLEQLPAVLRADVARSWPQGVLVTVTARAPVAVVTNDEAESAALISPGGATIATVPADQVPAGLAELRVETDDPETRKAVLDVLTSLPDELRAQVAQSSAESPESVKLELQDGSEVLWGSADDAELKASVLTTLLQVGADHYDVSIPTAPLTR